MLVVYCFHFLSDAYKDNSKSISIQTHTEFMKTSVAAPNGVRHPWAESTSW